MTPSPFSQLRENLTSQRQEGSKAAALNSSNVFADAEPVETLCIYYDRNTANIMLAPSKVEACELKEKASLHLRVLQTISGWQYSFIFQVSHLPQFTEQQEMFSL